MHKKQHAKTCTISSVATATLDAMADHVLNSIIGNTKKVLKYSSSGTFGDKAAAGAATLTLAGPLRIAALEAASTACLNFEKHASGAPVQAPPCAQQ
jgi:hypothetical protein